MMKVLMDKILLPVEFPTTSLSVVRQAAFLARHFNSEIILLHVVASMSYPVGMIELGYELTGGLHAEVVKRAQQDLDQSLRQEPDGIAVKRLLLKGDPAREIVQTAREEKVKLITMSTHGHECFIASCWARWRRKCYTTAIVRFGPTLTQKKRRRANSPSGAFFAQLI